MLELTECFIEGCSGTAHWLPVIALRPEKPERPYPRAVPMAVLRLYCETHRRQLAKEDIVTEDVFFELIGPAGVVLGRNPSYDISTLLWGRAIGLDQFNVDFAINNAMGGV